MVKFKLKANPAGQYYFPKEVREELGPNLILFCNARAAIVFPDGTKIQTVLESLHVITTDLKHRLHLKQADTHEPQ